MLPIVTDTTLASPTQPINTKELCLVPTSELFVQCTNDHEASTSRDPEVSNMDKPHIPRTTLPPKPRKIKSATQHTYAHPKVVKKWIPKTILTEQGYYQGATKLCLPKPNQLPQSPKLPQQTGIPTQKQPSMYWRPKQTVPHPPTSRNLHKGQQVS